MTKNKVYGSYKDGSDINKDKKGFYITTWNPKTNTDSKKYLKSLTNYVKNDKIYLANLSKKKKKTTKKNNSVRKKTKQKWWFFN